MAFTTVFNFTQDVVTIFIDTICCFPHFLHANRLVPWCSPWQLLHPFLFSIYQFSHHSVLHNLNKWQAQWSLTTTNAVSRNMQCKIAQVVNEWWIARNMDLRIHNLIWVPISHFLQGTRQTIRKSVARSGFEPRLSFIWNSNATQFTMMLISQLVTAMKQTVHYGPNFILFIKTVEVCKNLHS